MTPLRHPGPSALTLCALLLATPAQADEVPQAYMLRFNEVALRAEAVLEEQGVEAAIAIYEERLKEDEYGRVHLRLAQLRQRLGQVAAAAWHFQQCDADDRVDAVDRELICQEGFAETSAPVTLEDVPEGVLVSVVEPKHFEGPLTSGARLPKGAVQLQVLKKGHLPGRVDFVLEAAHTVRAPQPGPEGVVAADVPPADPPPRDELISSSFIAEDDLPTPEIEAGPPVWIAYTVAGAGLALVAAGVFVGLDSHSTLDELRADEKAGECGGGRCDGSFDDAEGSALLADGLIYSGAALTAGGVGLWFLWSDG